nr:hypothetical protein [uncultured Flavobacterium sp.]
MENFSYHVPVMVVTGGVATSGHSSEIGKGAVALIDRQTWSVATTSGNGTEFFLAQGSYGGFDWNANPVEDTHKSPYFYAKNVYNMYKSLPKRLSNEEWVVGYDGSASSVGLSWEKGKSLSLKFVFTGDPIYRKFGGPKEYRVSYTPPVDCNTDGCADDCGAESLDCREHTAKLIDKINSHVELKQFGVNAKLVSNLFSATSTNMTKWCLTIMDAGDPIALQAVQNQAPQGVKVVRTARTGIQSTYQFCQSDDASDPDDFTYSASVVLADCDTCPSGSTTVEPKTEWFVTRPLAGSEDLSGDSARQTYADSIGTAYETATKVTFAGTVAAVDVSADTITKASHGFQTGDLVTYSNGGGTSITGLTTATNYYVIAVDEDTIKLATTAANAFAGTAINLTVVGVGTNHSLTPVITATFLSNMNGVAMVKLVTSGGIELSALTADVLIQGATTATSCTIAGATATAWESCGSGISSQRTLKTKLSRPVCDADGDRLAELTSLLSGFADVDIDSLTKISGDGCIDEYTITQFSNDCLEEGCLTENITFTYGQLPSLDNAIWEVVDPETTPNFTRKCGIRITAGYIEPTFGNCSFDPKDYYNEEPVRFEVARFDEEASNCDYASAPTIYRSRRGEIQRQTGEWVVREILMKSAAYLKHIAQFDMDPRMREAFDQNLLSTVDRKAFYTLYYISFNDSYHKMDRKNESEKFTAVIAFKESDPAQFDFEAGPVAILEGKSGVAMHINS